MRLFFLLIFSSCFVLAQDFQVVVKGADEASFSPTSSGPAIPYEFEYDAIVIGGGLSGLTSALYLSDSHLKVLVLEKESVLGGLAFGGDENGIRFGQGAAYWTPAYDEELMILNRIGLGNYQKDFEITPPVDSYFWNGKFHTGVWEDEEVTHSMPASFVLFKNELSHADKKGLIPNQPIENAESLELDTLDALSWIKAMPTEAARRTDEESKAIYDRFKKDPRIDRKNPMKDLLDFVELFCRSALGAQLSQISALAFANFYTSEIDVRFASDIGTGVVAEKLVGLLNGTPSVVLKTGANVVSVEDGGERAEVQFIENGKLRSARSRYVVFGAQLDLSLRLIKGLKEKAIEKYNLLRELNYAHYSVHTVWTEGHPYREAYDTWTRAKDYTADDFTDVINARWQDKKYKGYEGMREPHAPTPDDVGILSIYHPLLPNFVGKGYTTSASEKLARRAVERMLQLYNPALARSEIRVKKVETIRWPYSIHLTAPYHFINRSAILRKPMGRVYFANNNIGTPAFEEALFRGHCAAVNIRLKLDTQFKPESWTRCPIE